MSLPGTRGAPRGPARAACAIVLLLSLIAAAVLPAVAADGPVADPHGLLSAGVRARIVAAARQFGEATGKAMVVIVRRTRPAEANADALPRPAVAAPGLTVILAPDDPSPLIVLDDPAWRKAMPPGWAGAVAGVVGERFRDGPFDSRAADSVELMARVLPDKIAFVMRPRPPLDEASLRFLRYSGKVIAGLMWFILIYTLYRTVRENRLKPTDTDAFSDELRRLREQEFKW